MLFGCGRAAVRRAAQVITDLSTLLAVSASLVDHYLSGPNSSQSNSASTGGSTESTDPDETTDEVKVKVKVTVSLTEIEQYSRLVTFLEEAKSHAHRTDDDILIDMVKDCHQDLIESHS